MDLAIFPADRLPVVAALSPPIQSFLALASDRSLLSAQNPAVTAAVIPSTASSKRSPSTTSASVLGTLGPSLSSTVKAFNPEAFCELCQKEFCNKYYLQTHRATKHGILPSSLGATSSSIVGPSVSVASASNNNIIISSGNNNNSNTSHSAHRIGLQAPVEFKEKSPCAADKNDNEGPIMQNLASQFPPSFLSQLQQPSNQPQMELQQLMLAASLDQSNLQNLYINQLAAMAGMQNNNDGSSMVSPSPATPVTSLPSLPVSTSAESSSMDQSHVNAAGADNSDISSILAQIMANPMGLQNATQSISSSNTPTLLEQMQLMAAQNMLNQSGGNNSSLANVLATQGNFVSNGGAGNQTPNAIGTPTKADKSEVAPTLKMEACEPMEPAVKQMRIGDSGLTVTKPATIECDVCSKRCDDVITLLTHKSQEHPETLASLNASNKDIFKFGDLATAKINPEVLEDSVKCDLCDKMFKTQHYLDLHKTQQHTSALKPQNQTPQQSNMNLLGMLPQGFTPFLLPGLGQLSLGELDQAAASALASSLAQNSSTPQQVQPTTPKAAKRTYSSSGKNYCDLCNKEVCNKYFLRTHMLKMHGIVIDENKTVIANIDTLEREKNGSLSFRCDQCYTELKSRSLLKAHKQEVHGIPPQPTQAVGQQRTPKHSTSTTPAQLSMAQQLQEQHSMKSESLVEKTVCPICKVSTGSPPELLEHLITAHHNGLSNSESPMDVMRKASIASIAESSASSIDADQFQPQTSIPPEDSNEVNELGEYKCTLCPYKTRYSGNLQMHLQNHDAMKMPPAELPSQSMQFNNFPMEEEDEAMRATTEVALKMAQQNELISSKAVCSVCSRNFSGKEALQKHMSRIHAVKRVHSARNPQKSKLRTTKYSMKRSFVCTKCHRRFATRRESFAHALVHTRRTESATTVVGETNLAFESHLPAFIREESGEISGELTDQLHRPQSNGQKEERNSHTSGSTSPVSMQTLPEGFAQTTSSNEKTHFLQSFVMREKPQSDSNGFKAGIFNELVAHLPVRSPINDPVSITFELQPAPHIDSQILHI
uniref:C2H2-type domain-containing protein n=1 Tax=Steinernema glaseri TaxID=37863 RepID=A0A1I7XYT1_9BILA